MAVSIPGNPRNSVARVNGCPIDLTMYHAASVKQNKDMSVVATQWYANDVRETSKLQRGKRCVTRAYYTTNVGRYGVTDKPNKKCGMKRRNVIYLSTYV